MNFIGKGSDFWVIFRKDIYNREELSDRELNEKQVDTLIYFKSKGDITTPEYAEKYKVPIVHPEMN